MFSYFIDFFAKIIFVKWFIILTIQSKVWSFMNRPRSQLRSFLNHWEGEWVCIEKKKRVFFGFFIYLRIILAIDFQKNVCWMPQIASHGSCRKIYKFILSLEIQRSKSTDRWKSNNSAWWKNEPFGSGSAYGGPQSVHFCRVQAQTQVARAAERNKPLAQLPSIFCTRRPPFFGTKGNLTQFPVQLGNR